jgi:3-hydroxyisobutyrate dehydrogenase-like beta-hydroxyacid dehydrogenase
MTHRSAAQETPGIIGMGLMGSAIGARLRAAGYAPVVYDVDAARVREFMGHQSDPTDVFKECRRVILCLPDDSVVRSVLPAVQPGTIIIDTSTGAPSGAVESARLATERGARYVDATISGSSEQVRRGEVLVMAGGAAEDVAECGDLFAAFAARVVHTGAAGTGAAMKLVTNLVLGLNRAALAEGLIFAGTQGISRAQALDVLLGSAAHSKIMESKGPKMVAEDFTPVARLSQHLKDVRLILDAAGETPLPLSAAHRLILETAEAAGYGALDNSSLIRAWETLRKGGA